jgi:hypothetical protein
MRVCSTEYVFHALLNTGDEIVESILDHGLRPLSDFPESERWQQINAEMPGYFEKLYDLIAADVLGRPYENAGVFVSPIDFHLLPESVMHDKTRVRVPVERIDPEFACITYVREGERVSLPFTAEHLQRTAEIWTADQVTEWFGKDPTKVFFFLPQVAVYQPAGIEVQAADIEPGPGGA